MASPTHRRRFLTNTAALAATASVAAAPAKPSRHAAVDPSQLAINGGKPVRTTRLSAGYSGPAFYDDIEERELKEVLTSRTPFRWYGAATPRKVLSFERAFAKHQNTRFAVAVSSGTSALISALAGFDLGPGDEVILPAWTWYSCYNAIVLHGALPVFAEIDETLNLDPKDVERKITPRTRAIMAVHILGGLCDMDPIMEIARARKLRVLEDCAQAVGASYKGRPVGSIGDAGIYSFQVNKTISAGEGGAVVTSDPRVFERAARFHDIGGLRPPHEELIGKAQLSWFVGGQYRMSEFAGAVMGAQLGKLDKIVGSMQAHFRRVHAGISDLPGLKTRRLPDPSGDIGYGVFIELKDKGQRDSVVTALRKEGISAGAPWGSVILPAAPHIEQKTTLHPDWPSFNTPQGKAMRYGKESCPRTIALHDRFYGVQIDPTFTEKDTDDIIAAITKVHMALVAPRT